MVKDTQGVGLHVAKRGLVKCTGEGRWGRKVDGTAKEKLSVFARSYQHKKDAGCRRKQ